MIHFQSKQTSKEKLLGLKVFKGSEKKEVRMYEEGISGGAWQVRKERKPSESLTTEGAKEVGPFPRTLLCQLSRTVGSCVDRKGGRQPSRCQNKWQRLSSDPGVVV